MTGQLVDRTPGYGTGPTVPDQGGQQASSANAARAPVEALPLFDSTTVCATVKRRRSLTDSLNLALQAFWTLANGATDDTRAAAELPVAAPPGSTTPMGWEADAGAYQNTIDSAEHLLGLLGQTHSVRWELPVRLLARFMVATLYGLVVDYRHGGDSEDARRILLIFSYQLSQFAHRIPKNDMH